MFPGQVLFGLAKARYCIYSTYFRCSLGNTWFVFLEIVFFPHMLVSSSPMVFFFRICSQYWFRCFPGVFKKEGKRKIPGFYKRKGGRDVVSLERGGLTYKSDAHRSPDASFPTDITTASLLVLCRGDWGISTNPSR